jgi:hypothetical protein
MSLGSNAGIESGEFFNGYIAEMLDLQPGAYFH